MNGVKRFFGSKVGRIVLYSVLSALAAVYLIYHIVVNFVPKTELYAVKEAEFDDTEVFSGFIFKDDKALLVSGSGSVERMFSNGEKVNAGAAVAAVYSKKDDDTASQLASVDREIYILEKSALTSKTSVGELDAQINALRLQIVEKTAAGEYSWVKVHSEELTILMNKRELAAKGESDFGAQIASLNLQRDALRRSLGSVYETVYAESSGVFYSHSDGYEGMMTYNDALYLTPANFDEMTNMAPREHENAIGTLMTDFRWYFVCKTDVEKSDGFLTDTYYACTFIGNACSDVINMKLESKLVDYESGAVVLRFSSSEVPPSFEMTRFQSVRAVRQTYKGLCVPVAAVRMIDGRTCVYIFKKGVARLREVNIVWELDGLYLVNGETSGEMPAIALNDLVVINEKNLYDGKIVG